MGLKTAVRYLVVGTGKLAAPERGATQRVPGEEREFNVADVAASFQAAVIDCLVGKAEIALKRTGYQTLCVGGGVAANKPFRAAARGVGRRARLRTCTCRRSHCAPTMP